jgi:hypothetical protein
MKKYLTNFLGAILSITFLSCSDNEENFSPNNMNVIVYNSHDVTDLFFANRIYFISFILNNGMANPTLFSKDDLTSAIIDFSNGKKDKVFQNSEKEYGIYSLIPESEQIPMSQQEFDKLPEDSLFRLMRYNEKSPYIIQPERRYSSTIPLVYAEKIKTVVDESLLDKNMNYDFSIEFTLRGFSVILKAADYMIPKILEVDIF